MSIGTYRVSLQPSNTTPPALTQKSLSRRQSPSVTRWLARAPAPALTPGRRRLCQPPGLPGRRRLRCLLLRHGARAKMTARTLAEEAMDEDVAWRMSEEIVATMIGRQRRRSRTRRLRGMSRKLQLRRTWEDVVDTIVGPRRRRSRPAGRGMIGLKIHLQRRSACTLR